MSALYRAAETLFWGTLGATGGLLYGYGWLANR